MFGLSSFMTEYGFWFFSDALLTEQVHGRLHTGRLHVQGRLHAGLPSCG